MLNFERSSLNQKLTIMSSASAATALLVVFVAFAVASVVAHRKDEAMQLSSFAGLIGANSVDALQLGDRALARATLSALKANVDISHAALYDRQGAPFAAYRKGQAAWAGARPGAGTGTPAAVADPHPKVRGKAHTHTPSGPARTTPAAPPDDASPFLSETGMVAPLPGVGAAELATANLQGQRFWSTRMRWYQPVTTGAGPVGAVMIEADLSTMWLDIFNSLGVMLGAMAGALAVALVLAARFKRGIAAPVTELIDAARQVAHSQDYSLRVAHRRNDELGTLIDSFNTMLAQIEDRGAELTGHRDALERQVGIRTAQLEKAKNAAEAASCAKSAFLATMSHEIRTPMNGVLGMTEMLLGTELSDMQREFTHLVKRSGEHLLVIINDILDSSKMEAGKLTLEQVPFRLPEAVRRLSAMFKFATESKGLFFRVDVADDVPAAVRGDSVRLHQILVNLVGNAIKFTRAGGVTLSAYAVPAPNPPAAGTAQALVRFAVRDTGIGIAADKLGAIFEDFSQANTSTTREFGGTGLGLSIARSLVQLHGGQLGVRSEEGQGSEFFFELTYEIADARTAQREAHPGLLTPFEPALRVLVAEDNTLNQLVARKTLEAWNVQVVIAENGRLAVEAAATATPPFDAVLMDVQMPEMDGYEATRQLRRRFPDATRFPVIGLTASVLPEDRALALAAGMNDTLAKPFEPAVLYARLAHFTGRGTRPAGGSAGENRPETNLATTALPPRALLPVPASFAPDWHLLEELAAGNETFLRQIVGTFLAEAPALEALLAATCPHDPAALARAAHKLKGQVAYFGVPVLHTQLDELERAAGHPDCPYCKPLVATIRQQLAELYPQLEARSGA